jgi:flagellar basal body-associated protein FliL
MCRDFFSKMSYPDIVRKINFPKEKIHRFLFTMLVSIAGALVVILIAGTIFGLVRPRHAEPILTFGSAAAPQYTITQADDIRVFSGLGRMRIPLSDSSIMILSIAFPYAANDIAFTEELASRVNNLRELSIDYFSSLPPDGLIQIDEEAAKQEILRRFNASLRLGRIEDLYFSDLMIINANYATLP